MLEGIIHATWAEAIPVEKIWVNNAVGGLKRHSDIPERIILTHSDEEEARRE